MQVIIAKVKYSNLDKIDNNIYDEHEFIKDNIEYIKANTKTSIELNIDNECLVPRIKST